MRNNNPLHSPNEQEQEQGQDLKTLLQKIVYNNPLHSPNEQEQEQDLKTLLRKRAEMQLKTKEDPKKPDSPYIETLKKELEKNSSPIIKFKEMLRLESNPDIKAFLEARDGSKKAMNDIRETVRQEDSIFQSVIASLSNKINNFIPQIKQDRSFDTRQIAKLIDDEINKLTTLATPINDRKVFFDRLQDYNEVLNVIKKQEHIIDKEEVAKLIVDYAKKERQQLISSIQQKTLTSDKPNAVVTGQQVDSKGRRNICSL